MIELFPLPTTAEVGPGDDLAALLLDACQRAGVELRDGDVVCVAQKVVSKAEGAVVAVGDDPDARRQLARRYAVRIVADDPRALIVETPHGLVCANGGIDASNLPPGQVSLLPEDPDASAARLRDAIRARTGADVAVVITDTFGRPWRVGQTDVAIGCAGLAPLRDERGRTDRYGRRLEATVVAVADELAAAADLVRSKADGTPFVLIRGAQVAGQGTARMLVRAAADDLFRVGGGTAAVAALAGRRTVRRFSDRPVPPEVITTAVAAAATAPAPHHTRPWRFVQLTPPTRTRLLDAMAQRWRRDLEQDGLPEDMIAARLARSDAVLRTAPELLVPFVVLHGAHAYPDARRARAEVEMFLLSGGAAVEALMVALAAHGVGSAWMSTTLFCADVVREVLGVDRDWLPLGMVAVGYPDPELRLGARPPVDPAELVVVR